MAIGAAFKPENGIPDLSGKVILVTGGNAGLGKETVHQLAKHNPAQIYLAARSEAKAQQAIEEIKQATPNANITFLQLDLTSLKSVQDAAKTFNQSSSRLDVLINNAGIMAVPDGLTAEGYEIQFGTNHVGHALLTKLLLPTLLQTAKEPAADVRVITLSSSMHDSAPKGGILFPELTTKMASTSTWTRYGQSKAANILFASELARRNPSITSVSLHPGYIRTNLSSPFKSRNVVFSTVLSFLDMIAAKSIPVGARNQLWAATAPREELKSGEFYYPVATPHKGRGFPLDKDLAGKLWTWTEDQLATKGYA